MKVTAMIDDDMINDAIRYSNAKNITEAVKTALKEYNAVNRLNELSYEIKKNPLQFSHTAEEIRELNRGQE
jgi:hypothetical protein